VADCADTIRELEAFLDSELAPEIRAGIEAHLGDCNDCLQAFDFHAELRTIIREKCRDDELPPGLVARIELCFDEDFDGDGRIG
jgi:mycothiol system anti-sigma-R factor